MLGRSGRSRWFGAGIVRSLQRRKQGISVLLAVQDEQYLIGLSIRSFLELGDEVIVVDNGSQDASPQIARALAERYPDRVRFFDRPDLVDLHQNRAFALAQARYQWVVRADSDYVCYTDGPLAVQEFRRFVLSLRRSLQPSVIWVPQVNVFGDFLHTGCPLSHAGGSAANPDRQYVPDVTSTPMPRLYQTFPGFAFVRRGRRETTRLLKVMQASTWPQPIWMHCTIKSDLNLFRRSERTNWRQLGDFARFPTLDQYIHSILSDRYGTSDLAEAGQAYLRRHVLPHLERYEERGRYPYPRLVAEQIQRNPIFEIRRLGGAADDSEPQFERRFLGFDPERDGVGI
jgi:glycosyltransferase involved in cell wall biosynthesis